MRGYIQPHIEFQSGESMNKKIILIVASLFLTMGVFAQDKWVEGSNGKVNGFTLFGGNENGKNLYLCAAYKNGTYHPGKIVGTNCNFGYGGVEVAEPNYFTLQVSQSTLKRYSWHNASNGAIPKVAGASAIPVGQEGSRTLYVCRAQYQSGWHPGKIVGKTCNFGWGGNEVTIAQYQVLMFK
jgi:hypothetical protein